MNLDLQATKVEEKDMTTQSPSRLAEHIQTAHKPSDYVNVGETERLASKVGGAALVLYGLTRRSPAGLGLALLGGALAYRGVSGHCSTYAALGINTAVAPHEGSVKVERSITINRSAAELYHYWRNFENLPCFMKHLESVTVTSDGRSHWAAKAPLGSTVAWDAEITAETENELIAWRSLEGADVYNAGSVAFQELPGGRGTVVRVTFEYSPPGGTIGAMAAKLFGEEPSQQVAGDLRRFKQMMEAGELATTDGQPSGRGRRPDPETAIDCKDEQTSSQPGQFAFEETSVSPPPVEASRAIGEAEPAQSGAQPKKPQLPKKPIVQKTSEDSFPASDPPAWTGSDDDEREVGA
jgi:uncharacterized membrane protein